MLQTDQSASVYCHPPDGCSVAYDPFGYQPLPSRKALPRYTGQISEAVTHIYLLGNGHRAFNPVLRRFHSPDTLSPFNRGGINAYAYCTGDPVNRIDPSGRIPTFIRRILRFFGFMSAERPTGYQAAGVVDLEVGSGLPESYRLYGVGKRLSQQITRLEVSAALYSSWIGGELPGWVHPSHLEDLPGLNKLITQAAQENALELRKAYRRRQLFDEMYREDMQRSPAPRHSATQYSTGYAVETEGHKRSYSSLARNLDIRSGASRRNSL